MGKSGRTYLVIILLTVAFFMVLQYNKPKEINWFPSYVTQHKIPFGTYVFNNIIPKLFGDKHQQVHLPPFEFLKNDQNIAGTYFFVNENISFDDSELNALLEWTAKGNTLFVASSSFEETFLDTLDLTTAGLFSGFGEENSQLHQLVHPKLKPEKTYSFEKSSYVNFFKTIDSVNTKIIGIVDSYNDDKTVKKTHYNVIKQQFGDGEIILSTFPAAFTNYFILKNENYNYTAGLLSYIDDSKTLYLDNHYKSGKSFYTSPMYIFLNTKEFKWAYYLTLIGTLFYVVFEGKRKQRKIPIIQPLKNQTLAFTRTIADMYFEKGEQKPITKHKIDQFLEYIRSQFHLDTIKRNEGFYQNLASRSSHEIIDVKNMFSFFEDLAKKTNISDVDLKKLNSLIEEFKHKADGK